MFGAIYGDVIGSCYEVHCTKEFDFLFHPNSTFTDDSVLMTAVCSTILQNPNESTRLGLRKRGKNMPHSIGSLIPIFQTQDLEISSPDGRGISMQNGERASETLCGDEPTKGEVENE